MTEPATGRPDSFKRYAPVLTWLPAYRREWLAKDLVAGLTAWTLTVPMAMAFAGIAGLPVQYGLYTACLAPVGYALFGTSRHLHVGPAATVAAISAATVMPLAGAGTEKYLTLTVALALLVSVILVMAGLARGGFIAKFLARPVLNGYIVGTAIFIAVGQLDLLFGVRAEGGNTFEMFADVFRQAGSWSWTSLAVGAAGLLLLYGLRKLLPRVPAALVVTALSIVAAYLLDLGAHGVALVGEIPRGLSGLSLAGVGINDVVGLLPGALALALFAFAESLAFARVFAARHGYDVDPNQEMIALGMANLGSGVLRGFPVDASFTRTAATEQAGGRTELASVFCSFLTFLTLFLFAWLFKHLPLATLSAIVLFAVGGLMDFKPLARYRRSSTADYGLALCALFSVLILGVVPGILIGVLLSLAGFLLRSSRPHSAVLGVDASGARHGDLAERPECKPYSPYLVIYRFDAPFIFSNADVLVDEVRRLAQDAEPRPRVVIVDCEMIYEMDTTASDAFSGLHSALSSEGIEVWLARVHAPVLRFMRRDGVTGLVGEENVFRTVRDAVLAFRERHPGSI